MATAPLTDQQTRNSYTATASQVTFPYTFWIKEEDHLDVYVNDVLQALTTDYTISAVESVTGANVVFNSGLTAGDKVAIVYEPDIERATDYTTGGSLRASALNTDLTYNLSLTQYLKTELTRTLSLSPSDTSTASLSLPAATASQVIGWNPTATGLANYSFADISESLDVAFSGLANGDYLKYDGANWVNIDLTQLQTDLTIVKRNTAATNPTVNDDDSQGYAVFSEWVNTATTEKWVCLDATTGAAVWEQGTLDTSDLGSAAVATLIDDDSFATATSSNIPSSESVKAYVDAEVATAGGVITLASGSVSSQSEMDMEWTADDSEYAGGYEIQGYFTVDTTDSRPLFLMKIGGTYQTANYSYDANGGNSSAALSGRSGSSNNIRPCSTSAGQGINNDSTSLNYFKIFVPARAESTTLDKVIDGRISWKLTAADQQVMYDFVGAYNGGTGALSGLRFSGSTGNISGSYVIKGIK